MTYTYAQWDAMDRNARRLAFQQNVIVRVVPNISDERDMISAQTFKRRLRKLFR